MTEPRLDDLDRAILERLSRESRISNRAIADALGVVEGTVRARIKRMQDHGLMRITAVTNIQRLKNPALAYLWIDVDRSAQCADVARRLAALPEIGFVSTMLGRADILAMTLVHSTEQLTAFLHTVVGNIPGVRATEYALGVQFFKHDYQMGQIRPHQGDA